MLALGSGRFAARSAPGAGGCLDSRREQCQFLGAVASRVWVADDEHLACRPAYAQFLPVQLEVTDLWVADAGGTAFAYLDVVACPELAEAGAGEGELAYELNEPGVVGVGANGLAEACDHTSRCAFPVRVQGRSAGSKKTSRSLFAPGVRRGDRAVASALAARTSK